MRRPSSTGVIVGLAVGAAVAGALVWWFKYRDTLDQGEFDFDGVDLASDDSFPASDPPSQTPVTGPSARRPFSR